MEAQKLPRETDQSGVTDPLHSSGDLSWMTNLDPERRADVHSLVEEIHSEEVTDEEKVSLMEDFEHQFSKTNDIVSCTCCGRLQVDRKTGSFHYLPS
mmetsp:Transcript_11431/g.32387  ORF Transcript_11431/g.32387 Transcript_11431/m.32387 type:complete len:97 (-) Transcript_11431:448-738(-)